MNAVAEAVEIEIEEAIPNVIPLSQFVTEFGDDLLTAVSHQNPPVYNGTPNTYRERVMDGLKRKPFDAQRDVVQAVTRLLVDEAEKAAIINAEMGTGKTMMAISTAAVMYAEGYRRSLVISPPHLVYKWRREILETVPNARVWVLNGPDTLGKLLQLRAALRCKASDSPEFFILGRVRMRMGSHWKPAFATRKVHGRVHTETGNEHSATFVETEDLVSCARCGAIVKDSEGNSVTPALFDHSDRQQWCDNCNEPLWTLIRPGSKQKSRRDLLIETMCQLPTIGKKTAERLIGSFGEELLSGMFEDNLYEFINLMDDNGDLVFSDRQATRMERAMASLEISFGQGGYQPTEYIKRYLPDGYFDLLIIDEGHEYKVRHEVA